MRRPNEVAEIWRATAPPELPRLELDEALRRYWKHLIGVALFPILAFVGEDFHLSSGVLIPIFFVAFLLAGWPYFFRRVPYTFCLVACVVWLAGVAVGLGFSLVIHFLFPLPAVNL